MGLCILDEFKKYSYPLPEELAALKSIISPGQTYKVPAVLVITFDVDTLTGVTTIVGAEPDPISIVTVSV